MDSRFVAAVVAGLLACMLAVSNAALQNTLHFVPEGRLAIRDLNLIPWDTATRMHGVRGKTIVGSIGLIDIQLRPRRTTPSTQPQPTTKRGTVLTV